MSRSFRPGDKVAVIDGPLLEPARGQILEVTSELRIGGVVDVQTGKVVAPCGYYTVNYQVPHNGRMVDCAVVPRHLRRVIVGEA